MLQSNVLRLPHIEPCSSGIDVRRMIGHAFCRVISLSLHLSMSPSLPLLMLYNVYVLMYVLYSIFIRAVISSFCQSEELEQSRMKCTLLYLHHLSTCIVGGGIMVYYIILIFDAGWHLALYPLLYPHYAPPI